MHPLRSLARTLAGTMVEVLRPALARELDRGEGGGRALRAKSLILHARLARARLRGDEAAISRALAAYWRADTGDFFYDTYRARFAGWFHGRHRALIDRMLARAGQGDITRLVELGCGDGQALAHCAAHLPALARLDGLDLNARIIARNRDRHGADPRIGFHAGDGVAWLLAHAGPGMVLLSYGGVLEYVAPARLRALFAHLAGLRPGVIALVEPLDPAHDLAAEAQARVFGAEKSFSHNYPAVLRATGWTILWQEEQHFDGVRWCLVLAEAAGEEDDA